MVDEYIRKDDVLDMLNTYPVAKVIEKIAGLKGVVIDQDDKPTIILPKEPVSIPYIPHGGEAYKKGYEHGWKDCMNYIGV